MNESWARLVSTVAVWFAMAAILIFAPLDGNLGLILLPSTAGLATMMIWNSDCFSSKKCEEPAHALKQGK